MKKIIVLILGLHFQFFAYSQNQTEIKNIAIFLQDNVEILDFAGPMEVFIVAGFNVYTVAKTTEPMKAMHSLTIIPDYSIDNAPIPDIIAFVGGGDLAVAKEDNIKEWVKDVSSKTELQFTVCTGAFFLAEIGFLDHMIATTYHQSIEYLKTTFPKIDVRDNVRFVDNGKVITTAGISAGIDGALHLVSKLKGEKFAKQVARDLEYDKWIPEEGLIIKNQKLTENDFESMNWKVDLYPGEILNLSDKLSKKGAYEQAEKRIKYVISKMKAPNTETYEYLRENYKLQNKEVPPTSKEFIEIIKNEGIEQAEKIYLENKAKFKNWVFIHPDDLIRLSYVDNYLKNNLQRAIKIQDFAKMIFPDDAYTTYVLGVYYERNNQLSKAIKLYKEAIKLDADFVMAKDKIEDLEQSGKI
nr:DJ-1/PfpI family protein [Aquimarina algiphila]